MNPDEPDGDRRPRDLDAERAVLGAMMLNLHVVDDVLNVLSSDDFYQHRHGVIFDAITRLHERGVVADSVVLSDELRKTGELDRCGGQLYIHNLAAEVATTANAGYYADIVAKCAQQARIIDACVHIRQVAEAAGTDDDLTTRVEQIMQEATRGARTRVGSALWLDELIDEHIAAYDEPQPDGVRTGFVDLDECLGGGKGALPGQMIVIAARPGIGKSAFSTTWALHAAHRGQSVLLTSMEMGRDDVTNRLIAAESKVRLTDIVGHTLSAADRLRFDGAREALWKLPIRVEDAPSLSLPRLRALAYDTARSPRGLDIVIVDYIQLLESPDRKAARREEVDAFSRGLKRLAKELAVPVVGLAQLNREVEARPDRKPRLSDLRESGSLEQDSDVVLMLGRPDAYERDDPRAGEIDVHITKNRNGPTATVTMAHRLHIARIEDIARGHRWEAA